MTLSRLVMWRHGETDYNATGRMQGHLDSLLTDVGRNQARFAVPALARFSPDIVVTSDLDEYAIAALQSAPVDAYGVGTSLVTGSGAPTASMVYKLVSRTAGDGSFVSVAKAA